MKNTNNRRFKNLAVAAAAIAATSSAQAAIIMLTADAGNSTAQYAGFSVAASINDGFTYDENNPTLTSPDQSVGNGTAAHGANGTAGVNAVFAYTASHAVGAAQTVVVDLWGRNNAVQERDNNFSVELDITLAGGGTTTVTALGGSIPDTPAAYQRLAFSGISVGDTINAMRIIGVDTSANPGGNYFTIAEVELATIAVPEPSSTALLGLGGLALILRRRK